MYKGNYDYFEKHLNCFYGYTDTDSEDINRIVSILAP